MLLTSALRNKNFFKMELANIANRITKPIQMINSNVKGSYVVHVKELPKMLNVLIVLIIPEPMETERNAYQKNVI